MSIEGSTGFTGHGWGQGTRFAFIDADNIKLQFESALKRRNISDDELIVFDINKIFWLVNADRYYVFSAVQDISQPEEWLKTLRATDKCIFRSGRLTQKGNKMKQQGVDVMIALEAQRSAFYHHLDICVLFSGDGDLLPLVDAIVSTGKKMIVVSFGDPELGDVSPRFRDSADSYIHVGNFLLKQSMTDAHRYTGNTSMNSDILRRKFKEYGQPIDSHVGTILQMNDGSVNLIRESSLVANLDQFRVAQFGSLFGATAFLKLHGPIQF